MYKKIMFSLLIITILLFSFMSYLEIYFSTNFTLLKEFIIVIMFITFCLRIKKIEFKKSTFLFLIFYFLILTSSFLVSPNYFWAANELRFMFIWPMLIPLGYYFVKSSYINKFLNFIVILVSFITIFGVFFHFNENKDFLVRRFGGYAIKSFTPTHADLGILILIGLIIVIYNVLHEKKISAFNFLIIGLLSWGIFLTFSRSVYVGTIVAVLHLIYLKNKKLFIYLVIFLLGTLALFRKYIFDFFLSEDKYLSTDSFYDRMDNTWVFAKDFISFFGSGLGTVGPEKLVYVADNTSLNLLIQIGVFGFLILALLLIKVIANLQNKKNNVAIISLTLIYSLCVSSMFIDVLKLIPAIPILYILIGISLKETFQRSIKT